MALTEIEILGNSAEEMLIALGIIAASLALTRLFQHLLQQRLQNRPVSEATWVLPYQLTQMLTLLCWLLPIGGVLLARGRLLLEEELQRWIGSLSGCGALVITLLVLLTLLGSFRETCAKAAEDRSIAENRLASLLLKTGIARGIGLLENTARVLMVVLPALIVLDRYDIDTGPWWLPATVLIIVIFHHSRPRKQIRIQPPSGRQPVLRADDPATGQEAGTPADTEPEQQGEEDEDEDKSDRQAIVLFFLNIFKHQSEAPPGSRTRYRRMAVETKGDYHVFELSVKRGDDWKTRRMTIRRLGRETGSRSKCFYVIYDSHLVIKLPPVAISDFDRYIASIERETRIADKLAIEECIIPSVSVILGFIDPTFKNAPSLFSDEGKDRLRLLSGSQRLQSYLKIGGSFAYFMDLSAYYFLEHVIERLHDTREAVKKEIFGHAKVAWDYLYFENQYGSDIIPFINRLEKMHAVIEKEIQSSAGSNDLAGGISSFQIKRDFFARLAGIHNAEFQQKLPAAVLEKLDTTFLSAFDRYRPAVENYRYTVADVMAQTRFDRNRNAIAGIVTNLMRMLVYLNIRTVAMRDLKPDNLLVAGDRSSYPQFLSRPDTYKIGMIDVETAVVYGGLSIKEMARPQLGGTPVYATPSHFFSNRLLEHLLGDLHTTLHLQDWHATLCIIYKTITGDILFQQTGCLIPTIIGTLAKLPKEPKVFIETARELSRSFWRQAFVEFNRQVKASAGWLNRISIELPAEAAGMMRGFLLPERKKTSARLAKEIDGQSLFKNQATRKSFKASSARQISQYRKKLADRQQQQPDSADQIGTALEFIDHLFRMKTRLEKQNRMLDLLTEDMNGEAVRLSSTQLLRIMFEVVIRHMYREEWKGKKIDEPELHPAVTHKPIPHATVKESRTWQATHSGPDPEQYPE
jgi:hypothetical protein